ncbi:Cut9-interacting protein scn1 [Malassezia vespertilionis]|uniref:Uncharacterized protein n=1 Tax=Malassezia vespertilionis TaxID=2020962 RepID=A0A2N1JED8_9BASI|nr:Cut9-interacting protein scn1 [Malassezia vespertilionis]PKI84915.1 hypothetical protein MVES_001348 [Malassezia vespertilionis]WFD06088.1 Cut9-interacting protein scn1 [Malassezia vespertilionis]
MPLVDAHCHATEALRDMPWDAWIAEMRSVPLERLCIMSTDLDDQQLVARAAQALGAKVVPCFGVHPWHVHAISLHAGTLDVLEHYSALFGSCTEDPAREALYRALPAPVGVQDALAQTASFLRAFPGAWVGEVGLDRSFRVRDPNGGLTKLQTPIAHQLGVLEAQVRLAITMQRAVSMHSVRCTGHTNAFLDAMQRIEGFSGIGVDLHSCTHSPASIALVQRAHANVYISFSRAINARSPTFADQVRACDPSRLLSESDLHEPLTLLPMTREVVHDFAHALGRAPDAMEALLLANFARFCKGEAG